MTTCQICGDLCDDEYTNDYGEVICSVCAKEYYEGKPKEPG